MDVLTEFLTESLAKLILFLSLSLENDMTCSLLAKIDSFSISWNDLLDKCCGICLVDRTAFFRRGYLGLMWWVLTLD